jgi:hypothetical protein
MVESTDLLIPGIGEIAYRRRKRIRSNRRKEEQMKQILLTIVITALLIANLSSAGAVDMQKFIQETQRVEQSEKTFRLIWWIPTEYWKESFKELPGITEDQKREFYEAVDGYIVLSVIDAKTTAFGTLIPTPKEGIVSMLSLTIGQGQVMKPLADTEVASDARNLFAMMKPVLSSMLGQFGQGMEFICFRHISSEGKKLLDPLGNGSFSVSLGNSTYRWRLPLGSLLSPKYDPQTGEEFPGNYIYNPFTGSMLATAPPNKTMGSETK